MAPVARELSSTRGALEPLQRATSLEGQILELHTVLKDNADLPATLIGWSRGAWLGFIFTAGYHTFVEKLILVGSGPYEEEFAADITSIRLGRLNGEERAEALSLMETMDDPATYDKNSTLARLGELIAIADSYDPMSHDNEIMECQYDVYQNVWEQAWELRSSGRLLELGKKIRCPVVAIHGDYDPHPPEGVRGPLSRVLKDFRFILLKNCGHQPWIERAARDKFYDALKKELD